MDGLTILMIVVIAGLVGFVIYDRRSARNVNGKQQVEVEKESEKVIADAKSKARELIVEAKDEAFKLKKSAEDETREARKEFLGIEKRIEQKESALDRKLQSVEEREARLLEKQNQLDSKTAEVEKVRQEQVDRLEKIATMTKDEAKKFLLDAVERNLKEEMAKRVREAENETKSEIDHIVKDLVTTAMVHGATDYVPEFTASRVKLVDEDMKGRIIGKEGRNIKAFEQATGVDVEIDETPGEILLSSFDPVRRVIAKKALERLMADGRIQPVKIEEVVAKTQKEEEKLMYEEGRKLCEAVGAYNLPHELVAMLGRFKHRFSYGQNMIAHTLEETKIGIYLAKELGADVDAVRLGCLFHDIGKIVADEEGTHVELGVKLLKQYKFGDKVVRAVAEHHEDEPFSSVESMIVYIADAISGSRPGARHESVQEYVDRLRMEEDTVFDVAGRDKVDRVFAVQAGRELRVMVNSNKVNDAEATLMAKDVAKELEQRIKNFPGQIRVTVIRESRSVATAR
jgi:ribonuclease Y